jgi:hypothetical protein
MSKSSKSNVVNFLDYRLKKIQALFLSREMSDNILDEINEHKIFRNEIFKTIKELTNKEKKVQ